MHHNKMNSIILISAFHLLVLFLVQSCSSPSYSSRDTSGNSETEQASLIIPSDQTKLVEIVLNSPDWKLRAKVISQITSQDVLTKVALNDSAWNVREAAMNNISSQNLLAQLAVNTSDWKVREIAFKKLQDQELLVQIAQNVMEDPVVRSAAIDKILNQNVLEQIGLSDPDPLVRSAAIWKLKKQEILTQIAQSDASESVRKEAIKALLTLEGTSTEKEPIQIKTQLIDQNIYEHYGQLRLDYRVEVKIEEYLPDETRYSLALKEKISVKMEYKTIKILNKYKHVIYERVYKTPIGIASGKIDAAVYDSLLGRRYDNAIDLSEICYVLIKSFDNENLLNLLNSNSDCLKTAASIRLEDS